MVQEMVRLIDSFGGSAAHTRCFLHIINLVAKSLLRQFDMKKKKGVSDSTEMMEEDTRESLNAKELQALRIDNDEDDLAVHGNDDDGDDDSEEGWVDEVEEMTEEKRRALERSILPVKFALAKVRTQELTSNRSEPFASFANWPMPPRSHPLSIFQPGVPS